MAEEKAVKEAAARPGTRSDSSRGQVPASELITADPDVLEEWKWDTPVWSHDGIVCTGETYREVVKLTFAKGAFLPDPHHLFNAGLTGNVRRAIDLRAGDEVDGPSFRELIREAVAFNQAHPPGRRRS